MLNEGRISYRLYRALFMRIGETFAEHTTANDGRLGLEHARELVDVA